MSKSKRSMLVPLARLALLALFAPPLALLGCGPPVVHVTDDQIPRITKLETLMDAQATVADPQFRKLGAHSYTDADFSGFVDAGHRIQLTSAKIVDFSKGPEFDAIAMRLNEQARALASSGQARDEAQARATLKAMKAICKECHKRFR